MEGMEFEREKSFTISSGTGRRSRSSSMHSHHSSSANQKRPSQISLKNSFALGNDTFALCPTEESDLGYFLGFIVAAPTSDSGETVYQLAWLEPIEGFSIQAGRVGCLYEIKSKVPNTVTSSDCFWEQESRLMQVHMEKVSTAGPSGIAYRLLQQISRAGEPSLHQNDEEDRPLSPNFFDRERALSEALSNMDVYQFSARTREVIGIKLDTSYQIIEMCTLLFDKLLTSTKKTKEWKKEFLEGDLSIHSLPAPEGFMSFVAQCQVPATSLEVYLKLLTVKNRRHFDPFSENAEVVQTIDDNTSILSLKESPQIDVGGLFSRNFVVINHGRSKDEKCFVVVMNSVSLPNREGQGKIIDSGWVIELVGKGVSQITYSLTIDTDSWLPGFLLRSSMQSKLKDFMMNLKLWFTHLI